ncbi:MAG: hypothetical protein Q7J65_02250 [Candidatus Marinimicrobia bacterium]|nr:hypothetical protein [Candidatus Neomarinimicrobiota bacterium]
MKKITLFLLIFISTVGFGKDTINSEKTFELKKQTGKKTKISQVSSYGYAILSEGDDFFLLEYGKNFEKVFICSKADKTSPEQKGARVRFSTNDRYLCINKTEANRKTLEIYDTVSKNTKQIKTEVGNVVNASVFDMDNIIYQVRTEENEAKTYLIRNGGEPVFITDGLGGRWSPNGKWFLVEESQTNPDKSSKKKRIIMLSIFDSDGNKMIETNEFGTSNWIRWSPTSDKIVYTEFGSAGFYIIYLNDKNGELSIDHSYHFRPDKDVNNYYGTLEPEFSQDGTKISFIRSDEDGHYTYNQNIWILEDGSYRYYQVSDFSNAQINDVTWLKSNELSVIKEDISDRSNIEIHSVKLGRQQ